MAWSAIIWGGFVATTLGVACAWIFRAFGWTEVSPAAQVGSLFFRNPRLPITEGAGLLTLFVFGCSVIPAIYYLIMQAAGGFSAPGGALVGLLHGMGAVGALPFSGRFNASVRAGRLPPPGQLGLAWGWGTPVAILVGHIVYGAVLGATLDAFTEPPVFVLPVPE
ncbi:MAG: hypothetical protein M3483_03110 [Gemmatimonadota bacterium]|nr:hypothetical protein [Gemmatimonadota bacterium]